MAIFVCDWCGATFHAKRTDRDWSHQFCSRKCYALWRRAQPLAARKRTQLTCANCGTKFIKWDYRIQKGRKDFCSRACCNEWQRKQVDTNRITQTCAICGKPFQVLKSLLRLRPNSGKYCSKRCGAQAASNRMRGAGNPNWKDGISYESTKLYRRFWHQARKARKRDNYTCQICGSTERPQVVHHIKRVGSFQQPEQAHKLSNLVTLCRSCHLKVHRGKLELKSCLDE